VQHNFHRYSVAELRRLCCLWLFAIYHETRYHRPLEPGLKSAAQGIHFFYHGVHSFTSRPVSSTSHPDQHTSREHHQYRVDNCSPERVALDPVGATDQSLDLLVLVVHPISPGNSFLYRFAHYRVDPFEVSLITSADLPSQVFNLELQQRKFVDLVLAFEDLHAR